jgi:hypothetical protein
MCDCAECRERIDTVTKLDNYKLLWYNIHVFGDDQPGKVYEYSDIGNLYLHSKE